MKKDVAKIADELNEFKDIKKIFQNSNWNTKSMSHHEIPKCKEKLTAITKRNQLILDPENFPTFDASASIHLHVI